MNFTQVEIAVSFDPLASCTMFEESSGPKIRLEWDQILQCWMASQE